MTTISARPLPRFLAVLRKSEGWQERLKAATTRADKVALAKAETAEGLARIEPHLRALEARKLVRGYEVLETIGLVIIDVDPARIETAGRALARIPGFEAVTQEREGHLTLD